MPRLTNLWLYRPRGMLFTSLTPPNFFFFCVFLFLCYSCCFPIMCLALCGPSLALCAKAFYVSPVCSFLSKTSCDSLWWGPVLLRCMVIMTQQRGLIPVSKVTSPTCESLPHSQVALLSLFQFHFSAGLRLQPTFGPSSNLNFDILLQAV